MVDTSGMLLSVLGILLTLLAIFAYRRSQYWKQRGVPSIGNIFWGIIKDNFLLRKNITEAVAEHYKKYKGLKFTGSFILGRPMLFVHDIELIKEITKDVSNFGGRGLYYDAEKDPLSANLLFMEGPDWKSMRTKLSPAFTSGKIKYMFSTILDRISKVEVHIEKQRNGKKSINIDSRDLMARLATDVILSVTLGILADSVENPESKFRRIGKIMFDSSFTQFLRFTLFGSAHWVVRLFNLKIAPKEANDFFIGAVKDTVAYREANNVTRNDFLDLMIRIKKQGTLKDEADMRSENLQKNSEGEYLTINEISAQAFFFFLAGFETTSATLSFALFQIAKHPEVQRKIHAECDAAMKACGGKISYETVQSLDYIEMAVQESQRLHPAVAMLNRSTFQDCTLPGTNVKLEKNTPIAISTLGMNLDPDFFPDPERFDPERFSSENKQSFPHHVFMPFGEGPRICIGLRFAMIQVKATILSLLSRYDIQLSEGTPKTIEYDPKIILSSPKFPIMIQFTPRKEVNTGV